MAALGVLIRPLRLSLTSARQFSSSSARMTRVEVRDRLPPNIVLFEGTPANKVNIANLFANCKGIIFGVPGAFTPGCSKTHLPGYVEMAAALKKAGAEHIVCVSVNDPFVMQAWGEANHVGDKIRMLADPEAKFTKALGLEKDLTGALGNVRSQRYSMVVDKGVIKALNVEPDGTGLTCSLAPNILQQLTST